MSTHIEIALHQELAATEVELRKARNDLAQAHDLLAEAELLAKVLEEFLSSNSLSAKTWLDARTGLAAWRAKHSPTEAKEEL